MKKIKDFDIGQAEMLKKQRLVPIKGKHGERFSFWNIDIFMPIKLKVNFEKQRIKFSAFFNRRTKNQ